MEMIDKSNRKQHVYPTYPRNFLSYRWFKPLLTGALFAVFYLCFLIAFVLGLTMYLGMETGSTTNILQYAATDYDSLNVTDWQGVLMNLGPFALIYPALALAALIVRDRPFSSYSSSRGGWSMGVFFKCLGLAVVVCAIPMVIKMLFFEGEWQLDVKFTLLSFVLLTVLGPMQCIAEEYIFRGLFMQTLGSWFRVPVIAVVLQAAVFAAAHPYNMIGVLAIFISGLGLGLAAWIGRGIEASSAIHVANNMTIFYMVGLNIAEVGTDVLMQDLIFDAVVYSVYVIALLFFGNKYHWFDSIRKDDVAKVNAKIEARRARKAEKLARKNGTSLSGGPAPAIAAASADGSMPVSGKTVDFTALADPAAKLADENFDLLAPASETPVQAEAAPDKAEEFGIVPEEVASVRAGSRAERNAEKSSVKSSGRHEGKHYKK